jgi:hypothetical protein
VNHLSLMTTLKQIPDHQYHSEHLSSAPVFREVCVAQSSVFFVVFCGSLFFFLLSFYCLFFHLLLLITPLVSSIFWGLGGWVRSLDLTAHTSLSPIRRGFAPSFVNYKKECTQLTAGSDKVYQSPWYSWNIDESSVKHQ